MFGKTIDGFVQTAKAIGQATKDIVNQSRRPSTIRLHPCVRQFYLEQTALPVSSVVNPDLISIDFDLDHVIIPVTPEKIGDILKRLIVDTSYRIPPKYFKQPDTYFRDDAFSTPDSIIPCTLIMTRRNGEVLNVYLVRENEITIKAKINAARVTLQAFDEKHGLALRRPAPLATRTAAPIAAI